MGKTVMIIGVLCSLLGLACGGLFEVSQRLTPTVPSSPDKPTVGPTSTPSLVPCDAQAILPTDMPAIGDPGMPSLDVLKTHLANLEMKANQEAKALGISVLVTDTLRYSGPDTGFQAIGMVTCSPNHNLDGRLAFIRNARLGEKGLIILPPPNQYPDGTIPVLKEGKVVFVDPTADNFALGEFDPATEKVREYPWAEVKAEKGVIVRNDHALGADWITDINQGGRVIVKEVYREDGAVWLKVVLPNGTVGWVAKNDRDGTPLWKFSPPAEDLTVQAKITTPPTPTVVFTPTSPPTPTLRPTETPTPTVTPDYPPEWQTSPKGEVHFFSDLVNLDRSKFPPHTDKRYAANFEVGDFPDLGPGIMAYLDPSQPIPGGERVRGYPTFYPGDFYGPHSVAVDIWIDPRTTIGDTRSDYWLNAISIYGIDKNNLDKFVAVPSVVVNIIPEGDKYRAMIWGIDAYSGKSLHLRGKLVPNAPFFELGKKYRLEAIVDKDRNLRLLQTDLSIPNSKPQLVAIGKLHSDQLLAFRGGHVGLYGGSGLKNRFARVWNANLVIKRLLE